MIRAIHGAPAEALRQALEALAGLSFWISWTSDPDLGPEPFVSARCMRDAANALRKAARLLDDAADRADPPPETAGRAPAPGSGAAPDDASGGGAGPPAAGTQITQEQQPEAEPCPAWTGASRPERAAFAPPIRSSMETRMTYIAPPPEPLIREIPLSCLALAPENVRKTPANQFAEAELVASIKSHGLLENLVARTDDPDSDGTERFAVVAGGRRLAALKALAEDGTLDADHPVPCKIAANGNAGELSLAENVIRIAMHPADQVVAFSQLAQSGVTVAAIAARLGVTERLVEQRLRLGNAAPELLDAYRADDIDLETLKTFSVTTDHDRQRAIWERVAGQGYRPSAWQVKRMLTEERVPAGSPMARFVGVDAYEAAGDPVLRDLFADEHENGVWLEDPALLIELTMKKLQAPADKPRKTSVVESIKSPAVAEQRAAALAAATSDGTGESAAAPEPDGGEAPEGPANGNGHDVSTGAEGEAGPEPVNGGGEGEDGPADPSVADAIDAMNAVPTADWRATPGTTRSRASPPSTSRSRPTAGPAHSTRTPRPAASTSARNPCSSGPRRSASASPSRRTRDPAASSTSTSSTTEGDTAAHPNRRQRQSVRRDATGFPASLPRFQREDENGNRP